MMEMVFLIGLILFIMLPWIPGWMASWIHLWRTIKRDVRNNSHTRAKDTLMMDIIQSQINKKPTAKKSDHED